MPPKMPSKKKAAASDGTSATAATSAAAGVTGGVTQAWDMSDPVAAVSGIIDKKARNLEKRKNKLMTLKQNVDVGAQLDKDQREAVKRLDEVTIQLEVVKDLQKQFTAITVDYLKIRKRQQKLEKQQQKDSEKDNVKKVLAYSLGVFNLLDGFGDDAKEAFSAGTNGAVQLTETELGNLDGLYRLLTPNRVGNPSYRSDLLLASDHLLLLHEQSSREVIGSTYKELHDLLQKIETCEYFDKPHEEEDDEEEEEEEDVVEEEEEESHDNLVTPQTPEETMAMTSDLLDYENGYHEQQQDKGMASGDYIPQSSLPATQEPLAPPSPTAASPIMEYMPSSVPSPTFPGLDVGQQSVQDEGFSFMHDSEVSRPAPGTQAPLSHPPNLSPSHYGNYPPPLTEVDEMKQAVTTVITDQPSTDVTTGQPSPSPYQTKQPVMASGLVEQHVTQDFVPPAAAADVGTGGELPQQPLSREPARDDGFQQQRSYGNRGNMRGGGRGGWGGGERRERGDWGQRGRGGGQRYGRGGGNGRNYSNQQSSYGQSSRGGYGSGGRGGGGGRQNYRMSSGQRK